MSKTGGEPFMRTGKDIRAQLRQLKKRRMEGLPPEFMSANLLVDGVLEWVLGHLDETPIEQLSSHRTGVEAGRAAARRMLL